jgi:putative flippase GtrA
MDKRLFIRSLVWGALVTASGMVTLQAYLRRREIISYLMYRYALTSRLTVDTMRTQFMALRKITQKSVENHTHGRAAAQRSSATTTAASLAAKLGLNPYFIQMSKSDQRKGYDGHREYFWSKDVNAAPRERKLDPDHMPIMIDVDYYLDMNDYLIDNFKPTVIYTMQPANVAAVESDFAFTFNANNEITYKVTGGGAYKHKVWNYGRDSIIAIKTFLGIPYKYAIYFVDRQAFDKHHELIMLTPAMLWSGFMAIIVNYWLEGDYLQHLKVVEGDFTRLQVFSQGKVETCTGRVNQFVSAKVLSEVDDAIAGISRTSKLDLSLPQVLTLTDTDDRVQSRVCGLLLLEYHRQQTDIKPNIVYPLTHAVHHYQFQPKNYEDDSKVSIVPFMSPIIDQCFAPTLNVNNEKQCIDGRINNMKSPELPITTFTSKCMDEFIEHFYGGFSHILDPVDDDEVLTRQDRPSQKHIIEDAGFRKSSEKVKMFTKKEAYAEPKDPRPISIIDGPDKVHYSKYVYALTNYIRERDFSWYAFGKTPQDIAQTVADKLLTAHNAANTDCVRMDGRISNVSRELEERLMIKGFRKCHTNDLVATLRTQHHLKAYGTFGTTYETDFTRTTGSPETAVFNTLVPAFTDYLSKRLTILEGRQIAPKEAWSQLGIYGGDDGISINVVKDKLLLAAKTIGQELTIEIINRGNMGVEFLARIYSPHVWLGDHNTMCDLARSLGKFHTTVHLGNGIKPVDKLLDKSFAFFLTDANTPVIGDLVTHISSLVTPAYKFNNYLDSYWATYDKEVQYPNGYSDWMDDYAIKVLPNFDFKRFKTWVAECKTLEDFLKAPLCQEHIPPKIKTPVVVNDDLLLPPVVPANTPLANTIIPPTVLKAPCQPNGLPVVLCDFCKRTGHTTVLCRTRLRSLAKVPEADVVCFYCKLPGHYVRDCPKALAKAAKK